MTNIETHRFGDYVALSVPGNGETLYLSAQEARALSKALLAGAKDVRAVKFTDSHYNTQTVKLANAGKRS